MKLFHLSPDAAGGGSASVGGSQGASGSEGSPIAGQGGTADAAQKKTTEQLQEENRFIRPEALRGILDARDRSHKQNLDDLRKGLSEEMTGVKKMLEDLARASAHAATKEKDGTIEDQEKVELKRRIKETEESLQKVQKQFEDARQREQKTRRETIVKQALLRQGCDPSKVDYVFRVIDPDLQEDEDGSLFSIIDEKDIGKSKVNTDEYIQRKFAKEILPQLFQSSIKQGAPAGGDAAGGAKFRFTLSQTRDAKFYQSHADEIRQAFENKQVDLTR